MRGKRRVCLAAAARTDLDKIAAWTTGNSGPAQAETCIDAILDTIDALTAPDTPEALHATGSQRVFELSTCEGVAVAADTSCCISRPRLKSEFNVSSMTVWSFRTAWGMTTVERLLSSGRLRRLPQRVEEG